MIDKFYDKVFTVETMVWAGDSSASLSSATSFNGHIQQTESRLAEYLGMRFTETFTVWCGKDTAINPNDRITNSGNTYIVKFVQERYVGANQHLELIVEKIRPEYV